MKSYERSTLAAVLVITALGALAPVGGGTAQAASVAPCAMRLRVELTPDVPDPRDPGFVSSLLGNHPDYQLTLLRLDPENASVITLDLAGPGPVAACREVVNSMRKDARVISVHLQRAGVRSSMQPMGVVYAGPDGDWVLKRSSGVSYPQQAQIRYECDIWAADQTGFDPTEDDGGVPPDEVTGKRADYLRAEAACFEAHGYIVSK
jgi:hypothetical protein